MVSTTVNPTAGIDCFAQVGALDQDVQGGKGQVGSAYGIDREEADIALPSLECGEALPAVLNGKRSTSTPSRRPKSWARQLTRRPVRWCWDPAGQTCLPIRLACPAWLASVSRSGSPKLPDFSSNAIGVGAVL